MTDEEIAELLVEAKLSAPVPLLLGDAKYIYNDETGVLRAIPTDGPSLSPRR